MPRSSAVPAHQRASRHSADELTLEAACAALTAPLGAEDRRVTLARTLTHAWISDVAAAARRSPRPVRRLVRETAPTLDKIVAHWDAHDAATTPPLKGALRRAAVAGAQLCASWWDVPDTTERDRRRRDDVRVISETLRTLRDTHAGDMAP